MDQQLLQKPLLSKREQFIYKGSRQWGGGMLWHLLWLRREILLVTHSREIQILLVTSQINQPSQLSVVKKFQLP